MILSINVKRAFVKRLSVKKTLDVFSAPGFEMIPGIKKILSSKSSPSIKKAPSSRMILSIKNLKLFSTDQHFKKKGFFALCQF